MEVNPLCRLTCGRNFYHYSLFNGPSADFIRNLSFYSQSPIVAAYGPAWVAGSGVASRINNFALILVMALSTVLIPFVGQNLGAGKLERIRLGVKYSHLFAMFWVLNRRETDCRDIK